MPKNARVKRFSFIEVLIVISIILSVGSVFVLKGSSFIQNFTSKSELRSLTELLNKGYLLSQITRKVVKIDLSSTSKGEMLVESYDFSYRKTLTRLQIHQKKERMEFYPGSDPCVKQLEISSLDRSKVIRFDANKKKYLLGE